MRLDSKVVWPRSLLPIVWQWNCHYLFQQINDFEHLAIRMKGEHSIKPRHHRSNNNDTSIQNRLSAPKHPSYISFIYIWFTKNQEVHIANSLLTTI